MLIRIIVKTFLHNYITCFRIDSKNLVSSNKNIKGKHFLNRNAKASGASGIYLFILVCSYLSIEFCFYLSIYYILFLSMCS